MRLPWFLVLVECGYFNSEPVIMAPHIPSVAETQLHLGWIDCFSLPTTVLNLAE
jgi:hypothetical protein